MKETESVERGQKRKEFIRFCIVGVVATLIQYGVYYLIQLMSDSSLWLNLSYTVGYVVSLVCNFFMTTYFIGGSVGTFCAGIGWAHFGWAGVCITGIIFALISFVISLCERREEC